jgi:hypothetical protein
MLSVFISVNACETKQVQDETLPVCKKEQVSTEQNPCKEEYIDINTLSDALNKLGESGTLPR